MPSDLDAIRFDGSANWLHATEQGFDPIKSSDPIQHSQSSIANITDPPVLFRLRADLAH
jgi:hypothetical protein